MLALLLSAALSADHPHVVVITVDDMNCDSIGAFGCEVPDITPRIDGLVAESLKFEHAHVQVGNCMPSRNVLFSGLYPHQNGVEGFRQVEPAKARHLADDLSAAGYYCAIRGKESHSTPFTPYPAWDWVAPVRDADGQKVIKNAVTYGRNTATAIQAAADAGKPLFLSVNVSDPHKPFWTEVRKGDPKPDPFRPSRVYSAGEVTVPGFLPDDPAVREELALYYSSVRRADDCVGAILDAVADAGVAGETLLVFLSDHGMPLPFAKTQLYHHSTRTPLLVRWPGRVEPGVDGTHMVSAVDFTPTVLEVLGVEPGRAFEGRSFAPLLRGESQEGRDFVVKTYYENSGRYRQPMRGIESREGLYLFNPWSDGQAVFKHAPAGTRTYKRMQQLAKTDPAVAARLDLLDHRRLEELYRLPEDRDCLDDVADDPAAAGLKRRLQADLEAWMVANDDPMLDAFRNRDDERAVAEYMASQPDLRRKQAKKRK